MALPSERTGRVIIALTTVFFLTGLYALLLCSFLPVPNISFLRVIATDSHYKYFVLLIIPTTSYFVIANWVGWQYFSNS
ncbi:hypothetical protein K488DRAFT_82122 [Vararia minispora EC-137]|uniref:Uncharacterized protein n=1 Tax=Vararia minispora EC-137 TaxID=1314806 RepID=A0ACB8QY42_9AGAM|nr:hypothetical protein K488DRAFT_82122 [Vararia minispora EC-137]